MIVSEQHQFVFVHIPKCAGTSVRHLLQCLDDRDGFFTGRVGQHADLGLLDYVHIPLFTLRDHFESDFERVRDYWSFAVMRDPFARFPSSISQRFRMYGDGPIQQQGLAAIKAELERSIDFLAKQPRHNHRLPPEYIHFQLQIDYVHLDNAPVVDTIYTVDEIDRLLGDVSKRVGYDLQASVGIDGSPRANFTVAYRNEAIRRLIESTRPVMWLVSRALPKAVRQRLRSFVYAPRDRRVESLFSSNYVREFISDYYHEDLALWDQVARSRDGSREHST